MIEQARARNVYDELVRRELTAYLREHTRAFDVIVSSDTLVYFGPLEEAVAAAGNALRAGGRFVFTVEELPGAGRAADYSISPNGRYRHARAYVERVLAEANLQSEIVPAELRLEAGEPVPALVVRRNSKGLRTSRPRDRCSAFAQAAWASSRRICAPSVPSSSSAIPGSCRAVRRKASRGSFITCSWPVATTVAERGAPWRSPSSPK